MLEILLLITMAKRIGSIMREKGRKGGGYQALLVLFWVVGEFAGALLGALMLGGRGGLLVYIFALAGAAAGAALAFMLANNAASDTSALRQQLAGGSLRACPHCGFAVPATAARCDHCQREIPAAFAAPAGQR